MSLLLEQEDFEALSNEDLLEYLRGKTDSTTRTNLLFDAHQQYTRGDGLSHLRSYPVIQLEIKKYNNIPIEPLAYDVPLRTSIGSAFKTMLEITSDTLASLLSVMLPFMSYYYELTHPEQFDTQKTIAYECNGDADAYFDRGGYTCWTGRHTIEDLYGMDGIEHNMIDVTPANKQEFYTEKLTSLVKSSPDILVIFTDLSIEGTVETHDFMYLKSDGKTYWLPIGLDRYSRRRLGLPRSVSYVDIQMDISTVFEALDNMISETNPYSNAAAINNFFPSLSLSVYPTGGVNVPGTGYKVAAYTVSPLTAQSFTDFWERVLSKLDRDDLRAEAEIIISDMMSIL